MWLQRLAVAYHTCSAAHSARERMCRCTVQQAHWDVQQLAHPGRRLLTLGCVVESMACILLPGRCPRLSSQQSLSSMRLCTVHDGENSSADLPKAEALRAVGVLALSRLAS